MNHLLRINEANYRLGRYVYRDPKNSVGGIPADGLDRHLHRIGVGLAESEVEHGGIEVFRTELLMARDAFILERPQQAANGSVAFEDDDSLFLEGISFVLR